jgi:hypothetical protein
MYQVLPSNMSFSLLTRRSKNLVQTGVLFCFPPEPDFTCPFEPCHRDPTHIQSVSIESTKLLSFS